MDTKDPQSIPSAPSRHINAPSGEGEAPDAESVISVSPNQGIPDPPLARDLPTRKFQTCVYYILHVLWSQAPDHVITLVRSYTDEELRNPDIQRAAYEVMRQAGAPDAHWDACKALTRDSMRRTLIIFQDRKNIQESQRARAATNEHSREATERSKFLTLLQKTLNIEKLASPKTVAEQRAFAEKVAEAREKTADFAKANNVPFTVACTHLGTLLRGAKATDLKNFMQTEEFKGEIRSTRPDRGEAGFNHVARLLMGHMASSWKQAFQELSNKTFASHQDIWTHYSKLSTFHPAEARTKSDLDKAEDALSLLKRHRHYHAFSTQLTTRTQISGNFLSPYDIQEFTEAMEHDLHRSQGHKAPPFASFGSNAPPDSGICRNWTKYGRCKYGDRCKFKHVGEGKDRSTSSTGMVCKPHWLSGSCRGGAANHTRLTRNSGRGYTPNHRCSPCGGAKKPRLTCCAQCHFNKFPERKRKTEEPKIENFFLFRCTWHLR